MDIGLALYNFEQNNLFIIQPRGQTTHLRPIKYTPLERGDSIHNKKFQPHIIEPTVKSRSYATFWLRIRTIG